jgi:hypothetical protein
MFAGRLVRGVKNGPSPDWMQQRLRSIGMKPRNVLVDITNLITHDRSRGRCTSMTRPCSKVWCARVSAAKARASRRWTAKSMR